MRPILFSLGSLNFYSYGFFTALGFLVAGAVIHYLAGQKQLVTKKQRDYFVVDALLFSLITGLVTARLGYGLVYGLILRTESFGAAIGPLSGGFIFYAGLLAGLAAFVWWLRRHKKPVFEWLDALMVGLLAGLSISEIGGYLNDGLIFHLGGLLGTAILTGFSYITFSTEKRPGRTFLISLFLLFLLYFFLGFWRPEKVSWYGFTLGQWANLIGMALISLSLTKPAKKFYGSLNKQ